MAIVKFADLVEKPVASENARFAYLTETVCKELAKQYKGKQLPPVEKQLASPKHPLRTAHESDMKRNTQRFISDAKP